MSVTQSRNGGDIRENLFSCSGFVHAGLRPQRIRFRPQSSCWICQTGFHFCHTGFHFCHTGNLKCHTGRLCHTAAVSTKALPHRQSAETPRHATQATGCLFHKGLALPHRQSEMPRRLQVCATQAALAGVAENFSSRFRCHQLLQIPAAEELS